MTRRPESVLAVDTGMASGWAFHDRAGMVCGTQMFPPGGSLGATLGRFHVWIADAIDEMRPEVVVYEDPTTFGHGVKLRFGMAAGVELVAFRLERLCLPLAIKRIKKHATGNGNAAKADMIDAARAMGWRIATDHEADAAWMAHYAIQNINVQRGEAA